MKISLHDLILKQKLLDKDKIDIFVKAGQVLVNDEVNFFPNNKIDINSLIRIKHFKEWVSRGAYKLLFGLDKFNIDPKNMTCIDIGSSTGGFTEVLLNQGATKVYCVDSGYNQLAYSLRQNEKTIVMEKTNLKSLTKNMFNTTIDLIVTDVSFISLKHVFNVSSQLLEKKKKIIALIKPEFEASSNIVEKGGYVNEKYHSKIIDDIITFAQGKGFKNLGVIKSPILGKKSKNIEYLALFSFF